MTDKSMWKNKNRDILLKNLPSWDKDAEHTHTVLKREPIDGENVIPRALETKKKKGRK